jgi:ABC-2 type transport system permease protein
MAGKLLPYTIIFTGIAFLFMSVLYGINGFPLRSGFWPMFLNYFCLILAAQGTGVLLFGLCRHYRLAVSLAGLTGILSIPISGFTLPVGAMSPVLQALSRLFPLRHFFLVYVDQALNGLPLGYSAWHYAALLGFAGLSLLLWPRVKHILLTQAYKP